MTLLYLGLGIILLCAYPFLLIAKLVGVLELSWWILLSPIWIPILITVVFTIGLVGFFSLFSFIQ